jgi:hypothetical protein
MKKKRLLRNKIVICMCNKQGFSLLSFLLYLVLFTLITFSSCHIIVSLIIPSFASMRRCQSIIKLHIATDLFVRDIRAIEGNVCKWKLITPHELIWQAGDHDIGWSFTDNRLERKEGTYNKEWKGKSTSIVAAGIAQVSFTVEKAKNNKIIGVELVMIPVVDLKKRVECYVALRFYNSVRPDPSASSGVNARLPARRSLGEGGSKDTNK